MKRVYRRPLELQDVQAPGGAAFTWGVGAMVGASEDGPEVQASELEVCRKRVAALETEAVAWRRAREEIAVQLEGSRVLADAMVETTRALTTEELCQGIGRSVFTLEPDSYVAVNAYVPAEDCFRVFSLFGFGGRMAAALRALGMDPRKMRFAGELPAEVRARYTSGRLGRVEDGLYELLSQRAPRAACASFASVLGIAEIYHVGFAIDAVPYGGISIMLRHNRGIRHTETIESLASHAGLVMRRRHAADTLRQSEEKFRELFEQSMDAIYSNAADGSGIEANRAWLDLFGYSRDELQDLNIIETYANPEDREDSLRRIAERGVLEDEVTFRKKDGTLMDCLRSMVARKDQRGNVVAYQGVIHDITARKRMEADLRASSEQMSRLARRVEEVREEERTGLARELHDTVGQAITAVKLDISRMSRHLEQGRTPDLEELGAIDSLLARTADDVRRISSELRPGVLDDIGLDGAIEWQIGEIRRRTGLGFTASVRSGRARLDNGRRTALFRVFQELLTNVVRHAGARSVHVTLECADNACTLTVADDGCGAEPERLDDSSSIGIIGMRERLRPYGGELHYDTARGKGTTARAVMPEV